MRDEAILLSLIKNLEESLATAKAGLARLKGEAPAPRPAPEPRPPASEDQKNDTNARFMTLLDSLNSDQIDFAHGLMLIMVSSRKLNIEGAPEALDTLLASLKYPKGWPQIQTP